MALSLTERRMHLTVPDISGMFSRAQEAKTSEYEIKNKLYRSIMSDMQILSAEAAQGQDELTVGFSLQEMKIDGIVVVASFGRENDGKFKLTELRWNDELSSEDKPPSPTRVLEFGDKEPNFFVQKPSLEARYNSIAFLSPPDPSHAFTEPKPANMSLADLSIITDKVKQLRIQHEVDSRQNVPMEHKSAA